MLGIKDNLSRDTGMGSFPECFTNGFRIRILCVFHCLKDSEICIVAHGRCCRHHRVAAVMLHSGVQAADILLETLYESLTGFVLDILIKEGSDIDVLLGIPSGCCHNIGIPGITCQNGHTQSILPCLNNDPGCGFR